MCPSTLYENKGWWGGGFTKRSIAFLAWKGQREFPFPNFGSGSVRFSSRNYVVFKSGTVTKTWLPKKHTHFVLQSKTLFARVKRFAERKSEKERDETCGPKNLPVKVGDLGQMFMYWQQMLNGDLVATIWSVNAHSLQTSHGFSQGKVV